jgi:hypothetical protein
MLMARTLFSRAGDTEDAIIRLQIIPVEIYFLPDKMSSMKYPRHMDFGFQSGGKQQLQE